MQPQVKPKTHSVGEKTAISQGGLGWGVVQGFDFLIGRQFCG
jgi:hypothetical protein